MVRWTTKFLPLGYFKPARCRLLNVISLTLKVSRINIQMIEKVFLGKFTISCCGTSLLCKDIMLELYGSTISLKVDLSMVRWWFLFFFQHFQHIFLFLFLFGIDHWLVFDTFPFFPVCILSHVSNHSFFLWIECFRFIFDLFLLGF